MFVLGYCLIHSTALCQKRQPSFAIIFKPGAGGKTAGRAKEPNWLEVLCVQGHPCAMSSTTEEIMQVCESLPPDKQTELADFARFLMARQDDEAWERRIACPQTRPRLEAFLRDSAAEGDAPLDPSRL
jgi:hypothetical protein